MLDLNITTQEQVMQPVTVTLTPHVVGFYTDLVGVQMKIYVNMLDANGNNVRTRVITVKGTYYAQTNGTLAPQVLAAIQAGATDILTTPSPVQSFIDSGDIKVEDYIGGDDTAQVMVNLM